MDRRQFLKTGLGLGVLTGSHLLPVPFIAEALADTAPTEFMIPSFDLTQGSRTLDLYRPQTKDRLTLDYLRDGVWTPGAYEEICWFLRDIHVNRSIQMDTDLIAILDWTQRFLSQYGFEYPIHILSGYRSPETNEKLENAAKQSQHLVGKAIDMRAPGVSPEYMGKLFQWLAQGGVGIYNDTNFVHIDTGRTRTWRG